MIGCGTRYVLRAAAEALSSLAERAHQWADQGGAAQEFAGMDFVGIDFSTSIRLVAHHVIQGWERYRQQVKVLRSDHAVWAFGVNAYPFPLTDRPVAPGQLPSFRAEHFQPRGCGPGLIEYGSAFYDYFLVALRQAEALGLFHGGGRARVPTTISLLCDGAPNGGTYRACDVRPLLERARARGVRFNVVGFVLRQYRAAMDQFRDSLGLTGEELQVAWYDQGTPDEQMVRTGFEILLEV